MDFLLLGRFEARHDGRSVHLGRRHERCLLGLLLMNAGRTMSIGRLVELLWDGDPPRSARAAVHTYVGRLRAALRPYDAKLLTSSDGYVADIEPHRVDVHRFVSLATGGQHISEPAERAAALQEALALWRGPLLADVADERLRERVGQNLEALRLSTVELLAEARLACGAHDRVATDLMELVAAYPTRERLVGLLMTALYRCGRQTDALALYRDTRDLLEYDFGVSPAAELERLHLQVLRNDPALDLPAPAVRRDGRGLLPRDIADFAGRDAELARLEAIVGGATPPLVLITAIAGTAGVGKTALAVHWAHRAAVRFPDAQLYINLRGYDRSRPLRPVEALARLLRALGVPTEQIPTDLDEASDLYRCTLADKRALIVLDNAGSVEQVRPLLPGGPGCVVLVTSRDRLAGLIARDSAVAVPLDLLTPQESEDLLAGILGAGRVAAERAAAAQLVQLCGRLPLALRIAAANLVQQPTETLAGYVDRLAGGDRLAALAVAGDPDSAIRSVFDQSYSALGEQERRLFRALGVAALPDLTAAGAAALIAATPEASAALLHRLCAASLVTEPAPGRYGLHDLLSEYARERSASEDTAAEREAAVRRLLSWYLDHVDAAARVLHPNMLRLHTVDSPAVKFDNGGDAFAWLAAEKACLHAAMAHAADHGPFDAAWLLADGLRGYFLHTRDSVSLLAAGEAARTAADRAGDRRALALAHLTLAAAHHWRTWYDLAIEHYMTCTALSGETGWIAGEAAAATALGTVYTDLGRTTEALQHLERALALNERAGRRQAVGTNLSNLGFLYLRTGPLDRAIDCFTRSQEIGREVGAGFNEIIILNGLGEAAHYQRNFELAADYQRQALALALELGSDFGQAFVLDNIAALERDTGQCDEALARARSALELLARTGDRRNEGDALNTLGTVHERLGQYEAAVERHEQALVMARQTRSPLTETVALTGLATACRRIGKLDDALAHGQRALATARAAGLRLLEGFAMTALAEIHSDRGCTAEAERCARTALDIHRAAACRLAEPRVQAVLDRCHD
jgi:DNA-binding SARP family transcriptional activator/tetratricopeptide (TPR) repeat protein